jgi:hypothetical protein
MMLGLLAMNLASRLILLMLYSGGYIEYPMAQNDSCYQGARADRGPLGRSGSAFRSVALRAP